MLGRIGGIIMANTYFFPTASTVAVILNGYHVDMAYRVDYRENTPKTPIYGYNDYEYTKVSRGKGIIQGLLVLNFTVPFYLNYILDRKEDPYVARLYNTPAINNTVSKSTSSQYSENLKRGLLTELPPNSDPSSRAARAEYIASLISNKDKSLKEQTKQALYELFNTEASAEDQPTVTDIATRTTIVPSSLTVEPKSRQGNTLDVYFQDPEYIPWHIRFNNIHFYSCSQQASQAGAEGSSEPLYEIYEWIASSKQTNILQ